MKHLKSKIKNYKNRTTITMEMKDLIPASFYKEIPDYEKLKEVLGTGEMEYPLLVYQATQDYYTKNHLGLYKRNHPELPDKAPEIEVEIFKHGHYTKHKRAHIVWSGRQRWQVAKELGYTHVDVIIEPDFFKMVYLAKEFADITEKTKGFKKKK